jgi:hypothetical protein
MPVEIRELVIRATVTETPSGENENRRPVQANPDETHLDLEEIIQQCVEQVLKILEHQKER